jgi:transcription initiation factor TFIIB
VIEPIAEKQTDRMKQQPEIICSLCNNNNSKTLIVSDPISGEIICQNCGQVVSGRELQTSPEWNVIDTDERERNRIRAGRPRSLARHDMGLATRIGSMDKDARGHPLDSAVCSRMERLRRWDARVYADSPDYKNLQPAFSKLQILKDKLGLSDAIVEKTAYIYRKAQERGLVRGRTISAFISAALYGVLKEMGVSRTLNEISEISNIKRKELAKAYRLIVFQLDLKAPVIDPMKYIAKVANKASISEKTKRQAIDIMYDLTKRGITAGKDPSSLAATVLYVASRNTGENVTQKALAEASGKSEVTVRMRLKDLKEQCLFTKEIVSR